MKNTTSKRIYNIAGISPGPIAAALIFFSLSFYLHLPHLKYFSRLDYLFIIIPPIGALGCYLLSTFYVKTFSASILAGTIYAFCPFMLAFSAYHRFAGLPAAIVPWLFIPAALITPSKNLLSFSNAAKAILAILAICTIPTFFYLLSLPSIGPFFPIPVIKAQLQNLAGIPFPLTGNSYEFIYGFYHLPVCAIIFGVMLYISTGSIALIIVALTALCLSFCEPIMQTPPIAWGLFTVVSCAILAAIGAENLIRTKKKFRIWVMICFMLTAALSAIAFTNYQTPTGAIYAFAALFIVATIPISAKPKYFRFAIWLTFYTACCADILWGAKCTLEQIFGVGF